MASLLLNRLLLTSSSLHRHDLMCRIVDAVCSKLHIILLVHPSSQAAGGLVSLLLDQVILCTAFQLYLHASHM
jgi:hypothetical protein